MSKLCRFCKQEVDSATLWGASEWACLPCWVYASLHGPFPFDALLNKYQFDRELEVRQL